MENGKWKFESDKSKIKRKLQAVLKKNNINVCNQMQTTG